MKTCERCGQSFGCEASTKDTKCWCLDTPIVTTIPAQYKEKDCLCPACLKEVSLGKKNGDLAEGEDFYLECGNLVFTAAYHLKKGHCCGNNCRHCPY